MHKVSFYYLHWAVQKYKLEHLGRLDIIENTPGRFAVLSSDPNRSRCIIVKIFILNYLSLNLHESYKISSVKSKI